MGQLYVFLNGLIGAPCVLFFVESYYGHDGMEWKFVYTSKVGSFPGLFVCTSKVRLGLGLHPGLLPKSKSCT